MKWFERLADMQGRLALANEAEADCLARYACGPGDHIEIGCLWGGTAILAALAKRDAGQLGHVITIDPMQGGWWDSEDPSNKLRPTLEIVRQNFKTYHLHDNIHIILAKSQPWPAKALKRFEPTSILIDGDHSYPAVAEDWRSAQGVRPRYILMHDYGSDRHPGVQKAINEIMQNDKLWHPIEIVNTLIVFERDK